MWGLPKLKKENSDLYNHNFYMNRCEFFIEYKQRLTNICKALNILLKKHHNALFFLQECPIFIHIVKNDDNIISKNNKINKPIVEPINILINKVYNAFIAELTKITTNLGFSTSIRHNENNENNKNNKNIIIYNKSEIEKSMIVLYKESISIHYSPIIYTIDTVVSKEVIVAYISINLPYRTSTSKVIKEIFDYLLLSLIILYLHINKYKFDYIKVYICGDFNKNYDDNIQLDKASNTNITSIKTDFDGVCNTPIKPYNNYTYKTAIYDAKQGSSLEDNNGKINTKCIYYILECIITKKKIIQK